MRRVAEFPSARYNRQMMWMFPATVAVALLALFLTGVTLRYLRRRKIYDLPNDRSSHAIPTPRGGGMAVIGVTIGAWLLPVADGSDPALVVVVAAAAALAAVSWIDDVRSLSPLVRLGVQILAVAVTMAWLIDDGPVFQGLLPPLLDTILAAVLLIWFINLFNFMDGIDAISAVECICVCIGLVLIGAVQGANGVPPWLPSALAAATFGFLWWNRPPARIFLGDVGSVPIGFLLGWMLLKTAAAGYWGAAVILPLYYLADATITLIRRAVQGEKVWQAHRQHFYQQAVQSGRGHGAVSGAVFCTNMALVGLALVASGYPWPALAAAALVVTLLLAWMRR